MNKLIFHKKFISLTKKKEVYADIDSVTDLFNFIKVTFPEFNSKATNKHNYSILIDGEKFMPNSWIYQNKIVDKKCSLYIVPLVTGGNPGDIGAQLAAQTISDVLIKAVIATVINFALSYVIQAILPKPKRREDQDATNRKENDIFSSIVNTIDSGTTIPLNYGMPRLGGHYISADVETVTLQKLPDQTEDTAISDDHGTGNDPGGGNYGGYLDSIDTGVGTLSPDTTVPNTLPADVVPEDTYVGKITVVEETYEERQARTLREYLQAVEAGQGSPSDNSTSSGQATSDTTPESAPGGVGNGGNVW